MRLKISHTTRYVYASAPPYGVQQLRLTPKVRPGQSILHWSLDVEGGIKEVEFRDQHDNLVTLVSLEAGHSSILARSEGTVETTDLAGMFGKHDGRAPLWYFKRSTPLTQPGAGVRALVAKVGKTFDSDITRLHALSETILASVEYDSGRTNSATTAEGAIEAGHGVCQDHTHIFIAAARLMGFSSRYVSGYLMMDDTTQQDAGHAWAEIHVPELGWVGFDVSNQISPDDRYVHLASGLDSTEAAPITGITMGASDEALSVTLQVQQ
ncbi:MAG: transglutaminase family protein [Caulobacterales bacterium]